MRRGRLDFSSIRRFLTWVVYELVLQAERSYAFGLAFLRTAEARYSRRRRRLFRWLEAARRLPFFILIAPCPC